MSAQVAQLSFQCKLETTQADQDLSILFRFSLLFRRSTRFLCIFSSIFAKRSRSSFAARLVRMASIRRCPVSDPSPLQGVGPTNLALCFLFVLHFLLLGLDGGQRCPLGSSLREGRLTCARSERGLIDVPLLACVTRKLALWRSDAIWHA